MSTLFPAQITPSQINRDMAFSWILSKSQKGMSWFQPHFLGLCRSPLVSRAVFLLNRACLNWNNNRQQCHGCSLTKTSGQSWLPSCTVKKKHHQARQQSPCSPVYSLSELQPRRPPGHRHIPMQSSSSAVRTMTGLMAAGFSKSSYISDAGRSRGAAEGRLASVAVTSHPWLI